MIGDEVFVRIEAEAIRSTRGAGDDTPGNAGGAPTPATPIEPDTPDPASTQTPPEPEP